MVLVIIRHPFLYEAERLIYAFFPELSLSVRKRAYLSPKEREEILQSEELLLTELSKEEGGKSKLTISLERAIEPNDPEKPEKPEKLGQAAGSSERPSMRGEQEGLKEPELLNVPKEPMEPEKPLRTERIYREAFTDSESTSFSEGEDSVKLLFAQLLYELLSEASGLSLSWGILTGVRPVKLMNRLIASLGSEQRAAAYFKEQFYVSEQKTNLALNTAAAERKLLTSFKPSDLCFYISIPFCPSRCSYCSFVSSAVDNRKTACLIEPYLKKLACEIRHCGKKAASLGLSLKCIYIGGGTPSILSAEQIRELLKTISESFELSGCREFCFEAGRPDTLDRAKLDALLEGGVDRISINPQTLSEELLVKIGRRHSPEQFFDAFREARKAGFRNINSDLIAGLPGDDAKGFERSLKGVLSLEPESITVHSLAYKRSSYLKLGEGLFSHGGDTERMINTSAELLEAKAYFPYYMYRQSKSAGGLENTGWCRKGFESAYNVIMTEETGNVFACGASAVTKLLDDRDGSLKRIFNFKYPFEYIDGFDEILLRKEQISEFFKRRTYGGIQALS